MRPTEETRRGQVLALLRDAAEPLSTHDVAAAVAAHPNSVRLLLDALVEDGVAERMTREPVGRGRPAHTYRARPVMDPAGPQRLDTLAGVLVAGLGRDPDGRARARAAGRAWGHEAAGGEPPTIAGLHRLLDEYGFRPDPLDASEARLDLRHCPFLAVLDEERDIVCAVHLGLMQGYVEARDDLEIESLEPFVEPDRCVARWRTVSASASGAAVRR